MCVVVAVVVVVVVVGVVGLEARNRGREDMGVGNERLGRRGMVGRKVRCIVD